MKILIRDKRDTKDRGYEAPDRVLIGERDPIPGNDFEIISVVSSKVGKTVVGHLPRLKWVICRANGYDNVSIEECRAGGVGICRTCPSTEASARWIFKRINPASGTICLWGTGAIARRVNELLLEKGFTSIEWIGSRTTSVERSRTIERAKTLVLAFPLHRGDTERYSTTGIIDRAVFDCVAPDADIISVVRGNCISNGDLLQLLSRGYNGTAHFDSLNRDPECDLVAKFPNVKVTRHVSATADDNGAFARKQFEDVLAGCILDAPPAESVVLQRTVRTGSL